MITTDTQGLTAGHVQIPTSDGQIPAYRAMPAGKVGLATVLVVQEIFGVHEHIKDVTRRLAKQGYLAVAPELYTRQGDPTTYTDTGALINEIVSKVPDAQVMADLDAAVLGSKRRQRQALHQGFVGDASSCTPLTIRTRAAAVVWPTHSYRAGDKPPLDVPIGQAPGLVLYGGAMAGFQVTPSRKWAGR